MRKLLFLLTFASTMICAQTIKTVGSSGADYNTLKSAFDAINAGVLTGDITLQIIAGTTETSSASLNASGIGSAVYSTVTIYPTVSNLSITGDLALPLVNLYGADYVTIDGRVNQTGSSPSLTFSNTSTSTTSNTSTIRFINSAEHNVIKYCIIKGAATGVYNANILISQSSSGNGNDYNLIDHCDVTGLSATVRPYYGVYSYGTAGKENDYNTISNCNFYDIWSPAATSHAIYHQIYTANCIITGNSFYETTNLTPSAGINYYAIRIYNLSANNFEVSSNYIGGSAPNCGSSPMTISSPAYSFTFFAIHIDVNSSGTYSNISGNRIKNLQCSSTSVNQFFGIDANRGSMDIFDNVIGDTVGTGSISLTMTSTTQSGTSHALYVSGSANLANITFTNNKVGSITASSSTTYSHNLNGIYTSNANANISIRNNLIGSNSTANSLQCSLNSTSFQSIYGINNLCSGTSLISGNTISNLYNGYSGNNNTSRTTGIYVRNGVNTVTNNLIKNIYSMSTHGYVTGAASVMGIQQVSTSPNQTITGNTIYNLGNSNTGSASPYVCGIYNENPTSGTNLISSNFIHSLSIASSNNGSTIHGIALVEGTATCANNIISLGTGLTTGYTIVGIHSTVATTSIKIYFNSVYIGGTVSGGTQRTYALFDNSSTGTRDFRNNLFVNQRSGGTNSYHYSVSTLGGTNLISNYNNYFSLTGTLSRFNSVDKTTLTDWRNSTGQDAQSINSNPNFVSPGSLVASDYKTTITLAGISGTGITIDFDGLTRSSSPQLGAYEFNNYVWKGTLNSDFANSGNWSNGAVPPDGANITFDPAPVNNCVLGQNVVIKDISNNQSTFDFVLNGFQLTLTGSFIFSNGAQVDGLAPSSTVVFSGLSNQSIPANSFVDNTIQTLTLNNSSGVALGGSLIINSQLNLTDGALAIATNTLTLNGSINTTSGSLSGGTSSDIIIAGSGAAASLPGVTVNNLTLNRLNGMTLTGSTAISGTLTLTAGTLVVDDHSLTISGNSILRTLGNINASNSTSELIFNNSGALTLPVSVFTGNVNNLKILGAGGVTSPDDMTITGILDISAQNPSASKGILDFWDGSSNRILTMGPSATTTGAGDVTGIIRRTSFVANTGYSFGNKYTTIIFSAGGTYPAEIKVRIAIGSVPAWDGNAIKRVYDFIQTGGSGCSATIATHYLDTELNGNSESNLVHWTNGANGQLPAGPYEWGKANQNTSDNWVAISSVSIANFPTAFGNLENSLSSTNQTTLTWNGSQSTDWNTPANWTPQGDPTGNSIIIPDANTTPDDPTLPASASVKAITLQSGSILNGGTSTSLTVTGTNGAWINQAGTFNCGTGTVSFTANGATIAGSTEFYNLTLGSGASLVLNSFAGIRIKNSFTNNGTLLAAVEGQSVVEYNGGAQAVANPNSSPNRYHNLVLSGSGTKTLPVSTLFISGNMMISGSCSVTANSPVDIAGDLLISSTTTFNAGAFSHSIGGTLDNNGTLNAGSATFTFDGSSVQNIGGSSGVTFNHATCNNSAGILMNRSITVNGNLSLTAGDLHLNSFTLTLGSSATLIETPGNTVQDTLGTITTTRNLSNINGLDVAGLGAILTTASNLGSTVITRGHKTHRYENNNSIFRYFDITPTNNTNLNATLAFKYDDSELNGISEPELCLFSSTNTGTTWTSRQGNVDVTNNKVTLTGVASFSRWTLASSAAPLPVEMISFVSSVINNKVELKWITATETRNHGFEIQRTSSPFNPDSWKILGFVEGSVMSNSPKEYSFVDSDLLQPGKYFYRLKQIDTDGAFEISKNCEIDILTPKQFSLSGNYPNPFNPSTTLDYELPVDEKVQISIYSLNGEKVCTPIDENQSAGYHKLYLNFKDLASGIYFVRINAGKFTDIKKVLFMK